jgi:hypothetical protein
MLEVYMAKHYQKIFLMKMTIEILRFQRPSRTWALLMDLTKE